MPVSYFEATNIISEQKKSCDLVLFLRLRLCSAGGQQSLILFRKGFDFSVTHRQGSISAQAVSNVFGTLSWAMRGYRFDSNCRGLFNANLWMPVGQASQASKPQCI
jgi:hypothetical protein